MLALSLILSASALRTPGAAVFLCIVPHRRTLRASCTQAGPGHSTAGMTFDTVGHWSSVEEDIQRQRR